MTGKNGKISNSLDSSSIKNIVFFDSSCNFENFKNILDTSDLIITFDYFSHNLLTSKKIVHEISDNFILESDLSLIQKKSYHFSERRKIFSGFRGLFFGVSTRLNIAW